MEKILELLKGKKTYIVGIALAVLGALQGMDVFVLPEWVWPMLGALGLGTLRAGVTKIADEIKTHQ